MWKSLITSSAVWINKCDRRTDRCTQDDG